MSEIRVTTQQRDSVVGVRAVPLSHLRVNATSSGAADTFYTVRSGVMLRVKQLAVANTTGTAATLTLHSIPSGDAIGAANAELTAYSVAANTSLDLTGIVGGLYEAGTVLKAYSGTSDALVIHGWGEEVL